MLPHERLGLCGQTSLAKSQAKPLTLISLLTRSDKTALPYFALRLHLMRLNTRVAQCLRMLTS